MSSADQFSGYPMRDTIDADIARSEQRRKAEGRTSRSHALEFEP